MTKTKEVDVGTRFEDFTFRLEAGKIKELAQAIGDDNPDYLTGKKLPPTIATVIDFWGGGESYGKLLDLDLEKVLHGGQKYEYILPLYAGDDISVSTEVVDIQSKKGMDFYTVQRTYKNQKGEVAIKGYATIIERG
ncbi:FAS1-like dehydratase domain-containing protein [Planococcus salinus]|uniref:MaoC family dehydratase n=1 Tax=Planococcus salinus TaxID=1848460 RepID=A0A3M8P6M6_9BACL|nr:MaoC family dehydratase N-terminal domain-containing protein [Planococcus salinus]RNF38930.1 MaoC family dehydratase [Planococcus salinus]